MLDWPNLIAGAVLGFVLALVLWIIDRVRGRRSDLARTRADWSVAAARIELMSWQPDTTWLDIHNAAAEYPIDFWRRILGPEDFQLLERLENSFLFAVFDPSPGSEERLADEKRAAVVAFSNRARSIRDERYAEVTWAEERASIRRDYLRHPIRTHKREKQNRIMRRAGEGFEP